MQIETEIKRQHYNNKPYTFNQHKILRQIYFRHITDYNKILNNPIYKQIQNLSIQIAERNKHKHNRNTNITFIDTKPKDTLIKSHNHKTKTTLKDMIYQ